MRQSKTLHNRHGMTPAFLAHGAVASVTMAFALPVCYALRQVIDSIGDIGRHLGRINKKQAAAPGIEDLNPGTVSSYYQRICPVFHGLARTLRTVYRAVLAAPLHPWPWPPVNPRPCALWCRRRSADAAADVRQARGAGAGQRMGRARVHQGTVGT